MQAFKKKQMKAFLCPCSGHAWSGVSGQPSPLAAEGLQPHLSCSATTPSQLTLAKCRTPMLPSHCFLTSSFLLQGPAQPHASSSCSIYCPHRALHRATTSLPSPALCSKICLQSFRVCSACIQRQDLSI